MNGNGNWNQGSAGGALAGGAGGPPVVQWGGPGGGGGWYGGAGGNGDYGWNFCNNGGSGSAGSNAGGGSGYANLSYILNGQLVAAPNTGLAARNTDPDYFAGIGVAGSSTAATGGNGRVIISWLP